MRCCIYLVLNITLCNCYSSSSNCTIDSECNDLNYSYSTGICLPPKESTSLGLCSCIYPCFQISSQTHRCELNTCYEIQNLTDNGYTICKPRNQSQMDNLNIIFSIFLFSFGIDKFIFNRLFLGIIQIFFGLWLFISYLVNIIYYIYTKPYPDPWHSERRYKYFCVFCCCQHSLLTIIYSLCFLINVIYNSINFDLNNLDCP